MNNEMKWKLICEEEPTVGKWYVVINSVGEYNVRYYDLLYKADRNKVISATEAESWRWAWEEYNCASQTPFKGFTNGSWTSRMFKEPVQYMELPDPPAEDEISKYKAEIFALEKKIQLLSRLKEEEEC